MGPCTCRLPRAAGRAILPRMAASLEIRCKACNRLALARAEPVYEDFKKVAETFVCTACGHRYPSREKTPFVDTDGRPRIFSEADKPSAVKVFKSEERRRSCAWCRHFIVNPFYQRCGLNNREVAATDVCARFTAKPEQAAEAAGSSSAAISRFDALFGKDAAQAESKTTAVPPAPAPVVAPPASAAAAPVVPAPEAPIARVSKKVPAPAAAPPITPAPEAPAVRALKKAPKPAAAAPVALRPEVPKARTAKKAPVKKPAGKPRKPKAE